MNMVLRLLVLWFVVSIFFGILLGKALKVLGRQGSGEGLETQNAGLAWHNDSVKASTGEIRT